MRNVMTKASLVETVKVLNKLTGQCVEAKNEWTWNTGTFVLSWANGKVKLEQIMSPAGGVNTLVGPTSRGDLYDKIQVLITGIKHGARNAAIVNKAMGA